MTMETPTTAAIVRDFLFRFVILTHIFFRLVWSNFEIGDLDFWRGEAYTKFFEFLDSKGGFYYEVSIAQLQCAPSSRLRF